MISAKEAKELSAKSDVAVDRFIDEAVSIKVKAAAEAGLYECVVHIGSAESYVNISPLPFEAQVMCKLRLLGYYVCFERTGDKYVPRGLADDDGRGPVHTNYGYTIRWNDPLL